MTRDDASNRDIGELLAEEGLITRQELEAARSQQMRQEKSIGRVVVEMGFITDQQKVNFLHEKFGYEIVDIEGMTVSPDILTKISRSYAEKHRCVPLLVEGKELVVAMENPTNIVVLDELESQTGMKIMPVLAPLEHIDTIIEQYPRMTQAQVDALRHGGRVRKPNKIGAAIHNLVFILILILPLVVVAVCMVWEIAPVQNLILRSMRQSQFDTSLYIGLIWALWAIVIWEIDAIFFRSPSEL